MHVARRKQMLHDRMMLHARECSRMLKRPLRRAHSAASTTIVQYELPVFAVRYQFELRYWQGDV